MKGSEFFATYADAPMHVWENAALDLVASGENRAWPMVTLALDDQGSTINVAADYFAIGEPDDFFYLPLTPITAQRIADVLGMALPTTKLVRATWKAAQIQAEPTPMRPAWVAQGLNPDLRMVTLRGYADHNAAVQAQLANRSASDLVSGTKKDVVLSNRIRPDALGKQGSVAIYGWFDRDGKYVAKGAPIQGLNPSDHVNTYADYSHGIRFVQPVVTKADGSQVSMFDPSVAALVSDEGPIAVRRYDTGVAEGPLGPLAGNLQPASFDTGGGGAQASLLGANGGRPASRTALIVGLGLTLVTVGGLAFFSAKKPKG